MGSNDTIDLEEMAKERAWTFYKRIRKCWQPRSLNDVNFVYDWSRVSFIPEQENFIKEKLGPDLNPEQNVTIFKSVFENKSEREQTHSLKAERQTIAVCKSSLQKGLTKGLAVGLNLKAPQDIIQASVGYSKGFSVTSVEETSDQKTLTWTIEGSLTVAPKSEMTAEVQIIEKRLRYIFRTRVAITGRVVVKISTRKNKFLTAYSGDMSVICSHIDKDKRESMNLTIDRDTVFFYATGECKFNFGTSQQTVVSECGKS